MPDANAVREPQHPARKPRDKNRVDKFGGQMTQPRLPKDFETRGRGRILSAFLKRQRRGVTGPPAVLDRLPEGNVRYYELGIAFLGASPCNAGALCFGVERATIYRWLREGADENCKDPAKRAFYFRTEQALACRDACSEATIHAAAQDDYVAALKQLIYSPDSSMNRDIPRWANRQTVAHTNSTFDGPPSFTLEITTGGYRTEAPPSTQPQLTEGDE